MKHRLFIIVFMLLSAVLVSGCWDRSELQDLNLVSAIGIDAGGDDVENRYLVTVQIVNVGKIAAQGQGGKTEGTPVTIFSDTGSTIGEAFRKISPKTPNQLFFPHVQLMMIGEELARNKGIQDLFDWLERDSQFRNLFPILIVRNNTAKNALQITTSLEAIPSANIVSRLKTQKENWGEYANIRADQVIQQLGGEGVYISGIQITGDPEKGNSLKNVNQISPQTAMEIKGLAIFKKGKLIRWLNGKEARGTLRINNELSTTIVNLNCEKKKMGIAVDVSGSKAKIVAEIKNDKPIFHIRVRSEGHISEVHCPIDLSKHKTIEMLQEQLAKEIKEEIMMSIKAAQEQNNDIFRFGEYINRVDQKLWKKMKKEWNEEIFPETEVNVNVKALIRRTGLKTKPYIK
ncbi:MAG TPA: Ger(x)C family spore germination protein [Candidatus Udaeobacter sp.]|nr:Ger(x)C family spore germination protein [Candidatus Udaeobacter sp.]